MCSTSFGRAVVPEVKYSSSGSSAPSAPSGVNVGGRAVRVGEVQPAVDRVADGDPGVVARHVGELGGVRRPTTTCAARPRSTRSRRSAGAEQCGRRDQHRAELHRGEDRLPQLALVAEHEDQPVAAPHALRAQPVGHLVGPARQLGERPLQLAAVLLDDPQREPRAVGPARDRVEPVERPVELGQVRPGELALAPVVVRRGARAGSPAPPGTSRWLRCSPCVPSYLPLNSGAPPLQERLHRLAKILARQERRVPRGDVPQAVGAPPARAVGRGRP